MMCDLCLTSKMDYCVMSALHPSTRSGLTKSRRTLARNMMFGGLRHSSKWQSTTRRELVVIPLMTLPHVLLAARVLHAPAPPTVSSNGFTLRYERDESVAAGFHRLRLQTRDIEQISTTLQLSFKNDCLKVALKYKIESKAGIIQLEGNTIRNVALSRHLISQHPVLLRLNDDGAWLIIQLTSNGHFRFRIETQVLEATSPSSIFDLCGANLTVFAFCVGIVLMTSDLTNGSYDELSRKRGRKLEPESASALITGYVSLGRTSNSDPYRISFINTLCATPFDLEWRSKLHPSSTVPQFQNRQDMHSYPDDFRNTVGVTIPNGNRVFIQIDYSECTRLPFDDATLRQKLQRIFDNADEQGEGKRSVLKYAASQPNNLMRMYIMSPFNDRTHLHIGGMLFAHGTPAQYFDGLKIPYDARHDNNYSSNISLKVQTGNVYQCNKSPTTRIMVSIAFD
ncbi:hypothetical protein SCHPADRAFT_933759 [Schizopora paradoxa]|uniref:Uncharacterized protein n=1 Tax=Schizopora paradoxa TaxID=27342 RepID=A0A0H2R0C2_9AGAM|nr:hypothetical protein SCHPADRAFT_933759 [Schizopora paradoxa]